MNGPNCRDDHEVTRPRFLRNFAPAVEISVYDRRDERPSQRKVLSCILLEPVSAGVLASFGGCGVNETGSRGTVEQR